MIQPKPKYSLEIDAGGEECSQYEPQFASYDLIVAEGNTLEELLDNATVSISDQDGGELGVLEATKPWMHQLITEAYNRINTP